MLNLKNLHSLALQQKKKKKDKVQPEYVNDEAAENEKREKLQFEKEIRDEEAEKKMLVQGIINEAHASGCQLPPSLIKLLHGNNGML